MSQQTKVLYEFKPFCLDPEERRLLRDGKQVVLEPMQFKVLMAMAEKSGQLVTKEELIQSAWGCHVDGGTVTVTISHIRKALGDTKTPHCYIETVSKAGYRFIAPIAKIAACCSAESSSLDLPLRPEPTPLVGDQSDKVGKNVGSLSHEAEETLSSGKPMRATPAAFPRLHRRIAISALAVVACLLLAEGVGWFSLLSRSKPIAPNLKVVPLTSYQGSEETPSFSPDGSQIAFSWRGDGKNEDVFIKMLDGAAPVRLTTNPANDCCPAWSPDGGHIAFIRNLGADGAVFLTTPLGGPERQLTPTRGGFVAWAPDAKSLAIVDRSSDQESYSLFLVSVASGERRRITFPSVAAGLGDRYPAFSHDGQTLAFVRWSSFDVSDLYVLHLCTGQLRKLTTDRAEILGCAWTVDDSELVFSSNRAGGYSLWRISVTPSTGAQPKRLAGVEGDARDPATSHPGRATASGLAYVSLRDDTNIWRLDLLESGVAPSLFIASTRVDQAPQFSPDGKRIAFTSDRSGYFEIWVRDTDDRASLRQLTHLQDRYIGSPRWSPDGLWIAFDARPGGNADIYVVGAEGGPPHRLTTEASVEGRPSWSQDGRRIYFRSDRSGSHQIWKMPAEGGNPVQVTKAGGFEAFESPDGKLVYYVKSTSSPGLWSVPVAGGEERPVLDSVWPSFWAVADKGIYFLELDSAPSSPKQLKFFNFKTRQAERIDTISIGVTLSSPGFSVTRDGRSLLVARQEYWDSDLMLVENFR